MASKNKYVASIVLEGEKEFTSAVTACNKRLETMRSELKLNKETYAGNANSLKALKDNCEVLERTLQVQNEKIKSTQKGLINARQEYEKVGKGLNDLKEKYFTATRELEKMKESSQSTEEIKKQELALEQLASAIEKGENNYRAAENRVENWKRKLNTAQAQEKKTCRELETYRKYMYEAKKSVDQCAISIDAYGKRTKESEVATKEAVNSLAQVIASSDMQQKVEDVANALYDCSKAADEFGMTTAKIGTIADTSTVSMEQIKQDLMEISGEMAQDINVLGDAAYEAISAGTATEKAIEVTATATKAAMGGFTDASTAIDGLSTVVNSYGDKVKGATEVSDVFLTVQNLGKTTFGELSSSIGRVATNAANYNLSLQDLGTAYIELTKRGIQTTEATTYTNSLLKELGKNSSNLSKVLTNKTGKSFEELMKEGKSLGDVLGIIYDSVGNSNTAFNNLFGSQEAATAAVTLLKSGTEGYNKTLQEVRNSAGATDKAYKKMTETSEFAKQKIANSINNIKIAIGEQLNKELGNLVGKCENLTEWVENVIEEHPEIVRVVTALVVSLGTLTAIIAGYTIATKVVIPMIYQFNTALASNPIGLVTVALSTLVTGLITFNTMVKSSTDAIDKEVVAMEKSRKAIEEKNKTIQESIKNTKNELESTQDEVSTKKNLINQLLELNDVQNKTVGQKQKMKGIVEKLKQDIPALADAYDEEAGKVNLTRNEVLKLADAYKEQAIAAGASKQIEEATTAAAEAETNYQKALESRKAINKEVEAAEEAAEKARKRFETAQENATKNGDYNGETIQKEREEYLEKQQIYNKLVGEEKKLKKAEKEAKKTREDANKVLDDSINYYDKFMQRMQKQNKEQEKSASSNKKTVSDYDKISSAFEKATKELDKCGDSVSATTKNKFNSAVKMAKKTGTDIPSGLAKGLKNGSKSPEKAVKEINKATSSKLLEMANDARSAGVYITDEITDGLSNGTYNVETAYKKITKAINRKADEQQEKLDKAYLKIPKSMKKAFDKGGNASIEAIKEADTKLKNLMEDAGVNSINGLLKGLEENKPRVKAAYTDIADEADNAWKKRTKTHSPSRVFAENGEYTVLGVISGVEALKGKLKKKYEELGGISDAAFRASLEIHSPSKKFQKSGNHTVDGLIKGIEQKKSNLKKSANELGNLLIEKMQNKIDMKDLKTNGNGYSATTITKYWNSVVKATKKGTSAHKEALKNYYTARNELVNEKKEKLKEIKSSYKEIMSELKEEIQEAKEEYANAIEETQKSISGTWGLFNKASVTKTNNADGLIRNMKSQATTTQEWSKNLDKLRKSGLSSELIEELEAAGLSSAGDVATLASMTKSQLAEYQKYYNQRNTIAKNEAAKENADLKKTTDSKIASLQKNAKKEIDTLEKQYKKIQKQIKKLDAKTKKQLKNLGLNVSQGFAKGISSGSNDVYSAIAKMTGQTVKQVKKNLGIHSPSRVMAELGGYTGLGFAQGLEKETQNLADILTSALPDTVTAPTPQRAVSTEPTLLSGNKSVQLNMYMDSNVVATATFKTIDLLQGANIRLMNRGLAT